MLPHNSCTQYLPQFFAVPLAFLGYYSTQSVLSNGIPRVATRGALVEKSGFSCAVVSWAGFADISRWGARIHLISFPTSSPYPPLPSPRVS
ncbi:hypothetical protein PISMIDRAFT_689888 [Pisolithus microcarpus 441]|uniref:Uncharacterized protein n=1 Tax=Pisolithus microcarpus 441 TaxID=765257 RepID=A0A0C9YDY2_9AGAM|nr:hypothetical protein BKA83DRAFT_689888 [Pisolithus microcarpus]KIK11999.1 hypothetical protein PISMIDRAFT_689888 [Pisolithus microcarpus 441]